MIQIVQIENIEINGYELKSKWLKNEFLIY